MTNGLLTVGQIAEDLDQTTGRIDYVIRTRRIRPVARAGLYRLFTQQQVKEISAHIAQLRRYTTPPVGEQHV